MKSYWYRIIREDVEIDLYADDMIMKEVYLKIEPFYKIEKVDQPADDKWKIYYENKLEKTPPKNRKSMEEVYLPLTTTGEPPRRFVIDGEFKMINVLEPKDTLWKIQLVVRLIRDISRYEFISKRMFYFHSAMIFYQEKGICVMGEKKTGKTTTVLSLLNTKKAKYISNDDLSIRIDNNEIKGYGWPRSISVRKDTIKEVCKINDLAPLEDVFFKHPSHKVQMKEGYVFFYPKEFVNYLGSELLTHAKIDVIIFSEFIDGDKPKIEELNRNEYYQQLMKNLETKQNNYARAFEKYFNEYKKINIDSVVDIITRKIKAYKLYQNIKNLDKSLEMINGILP